MITRTKAPRAVAVLGAAATLALTLFGTIIAVSPIETQAAGSIVRAGWAFAWGDNTWGQLGNGITTNSLTPVGVNLPAGTTVTAISGGISHSLALTSTGQILACS
jgi:alpha-tubulin suppressor-like RCC1 family protein